MKTTLLSLLAILLLASNGICGPISVCGGRYEVPRFVEDGSTKPVSEEYSCGAVIYLEEGSGDQRYVKSLYGFLSYKDMIPAESMQRFQKFVAGFINRAAGHDLGDFRAADPISSNIAGTNIYIFVQNFDQLYDGVRYSGAYEIVTKVEGDRTNSYFIGFPSESGVPTYYDRFRDWALK